MERLVRIMRVPAVLGVLGLSAACADVATENPTEPIIPGAPQLNPEILSASWRFDVDLTSSQIYTTAPESGLDGLSTSIIAEHFGLDGDDPQLSILGGDVVELTPSVLDFGVPRALPGVGSGFVRDVSWEVEVRNLISGIELLAPTFPAPPAGTQFPILIPFNQVTTVTSGGVNCEVGATSFTTDCFVEAPSEGNVFVSDAGGINSAGNGFNSGYQGPPHNFFNDSPCEPSGTYFGQGNQSDCRPYRELTQTIAGGATAAPVVVNYTLDQTVNQFRVEILLGADITDGTPDATPPVIGAITEDGPARIGDPINLTAAATDDRTAAALIGFGWDFTNAGAGPFTDATGASVQFICPSAGTFTLGLEATDGAGNASTTTVAVDCVSNAAPVVGFIGAPYSTAVGTSVTVDAGASTDDLGIATYEIQIDGGGFGAPQAGPQFSVTCPATPGTLAIDVRATDAPEGAQSVGSTTVTCTPPANIFLVWTDAGGSAITSTTAGSTVFLQVCTTVDATQAIQGDITGVNGTGLLTQVAQGPASSTDLNSNSGAGACLDAGASDVVDQHTGGSLGSDPFNFQNFSIAAGAGTGIVGLASIEFTADAAGTVNADFVPSVWSLFSGSAPAAISGGGTLTIN